MNWKKLLAVMTAIFVLIGVGYFFSFRLLESPLGLTADEAAFGLNAELLARTGYDENGAYLPVFVLSLDGNDWRQPVPQYYMALFFKLFGSSVYNLRFSSVVVTLGSALLLYVLASKVMGRNWGIVTAISFMLTPLVLMQSHLGLDNTMPIPFTILWLLGVFMYEKTGKPLYLALAGVSLGLGFYTYKGMRATVPVWCALTGLYLIYDWLKTRTAPAFKKVILRCAWFGVGVLPFFAVIPILQKLYPGAIFDGQGAKWESVYGFLNPYISSFDWSFLYIKGDATPWHSTGKHGMMLLASLPLFILGVFEAIKKKSFWLLVLGAFFTAPLLFGFVDSVHRASRLMSMIPPYALLSGLGAQWLWHRKKLGLIVLAGAAFLNFADFTHYYWYKYPELTRVWFGDMSVHRDFQELAKQADMLQKSPFISDHITRQEGVSGRFYDEAYLHGTARPVSDSDELPSDAVLLSGRTEIPGMKKLDVNMVKYNLHVVDSSDE